MRSAVLASIANGLQQVDQPPQLGRISDSSVCVEVDPEEMVVGVLRLVAPLYARPRIAWVEAVAEVLTDRTALGADASEVDLARAVAYPPRLVADLGQRAAESSPLVHAGLPESLQQLRFQHFESCHLGSFT